FGAKRFLRYERESKCTGVYQRDSKAHQHWKMSQTRLIVLLSRDRCQLEKLYTPIHRTLDVTTLARLTFHVHCMHVPLWLAISGLLHPKWGQSTSIKHPSRTES
ncbi:hypothetical protein NEUTE2DRAFT_60887, partial [Neurospora tetrasperma FGSC 2509]